MSLSADDIEQIRTLEVALWVAETRGDPQWMERNLAPAFHEFGASGRRWTREEIVTLPISSPIPVELPLSDLVVREIDERVALVTYTSVLDGAIANRASLWRKEGGRWRLEFHQGTPAAGGL